MKKIHFIIYVCDNEFFLKQENGQVIREKFKSIENEEIINSSLFREEFNRFIHKQHIKISLFGKNISFIINRNLSPLSKEKYLEIFEEYFRKIHFIELENLLSIDNENGILFVTKKYIDYYYMKKNTIESIRINLKIFNNNYSKAIQHIINIFYKSPNIIVLGPVENLMSLAEEIQKKYNIKTTFPEAYFTYILEEYKK